MNDSDEPSARITLGTIVGNSATNGGGIYALASTNFANTPTTAVAGVTFSLNDPNDCEGGGTLGC